MAERTAVLVHDALAEQLAAGAARRPHQRNRYDILDAGARIRAGEADQTLHIVRVVRDERRRHDRQQRKQQAAQHKVIRL